jgi:hypothetical protein
MGNVVYIFVEDTKQQTLRSSLFSLLAVIPPICIAFGTRNVDLLVGITGSYAGLGIMFLIPTSLVFYSRR